MNIAVDMGHEFGMHLHRNLIMLVYLWKLSNFIYKMRRNCVVRPEVLRNVLDVITEASNNPTYAIVSQNVLQNKRPRRSNTKHKTPLLPSGSLWFEFLF